MRALTTLINKAQIHVPALALVALAILIKTSLLLSIPSQSILMENDSLRYLRISGEFGSVFFGGKSNLDSFFITPGYPLFLSMFSSENLKLIIFCQFLLLGISQVLLFKMIVKHTSIKVAYIGLVVFLIESSSTLEAFNLLTETLFNFIFVLFLYLFGNGTSKNHAFYTSGLILGLALIVRPVGQILLIPLLLMVVLKAWRRHVLIVLLIAVAVSSTWIIRNQIVFGVPQLSGIQSLNLLQFEGAGAFAKENHISLKEAQAKESRLEIDTVGESASIQTVVEYRVDRGVHLILSNPTGFIKLHLEGAVKILMGPGSANINKLTAHLAPSELVTNALEALIVLMRLLVTSWVCVCIFLAAKRREFVPIQFYSMVSWILILISSGGANAYSRFRVPLVPLEIIIICIGLSSPYQRALVEKITSRIKSAIRDLKGQANSVAVNDSPTQGMAQNRRVEIGIEE